jgi:Thioredoxin
VRIACEHNSAAVVAGARARGRLGEVFLGDICRDVRRPWPAQTYSPHPAAYPLYDSQPPEGSDGLNDEELVQLGLQSGLDEAFGSCVRAGKYLGWAEYVTAIAIARGVNGTPSVYVDGMGVPASADAITAAALAEMG